MDQPPAFAPGFRISLADGLVLVGGAIGTLWLWQSLWWAGMILATVVGHFFFFCNVFRISRAPELIWAAVFIFLTAGTLVFNIPGWLTTISASVVVAIILIIREMKRPSYHGVGWRAINPGLPKWWESHADRKV